MTSESETEIGDTSNNVSFKWTDEMTFVLLDAYCMRRRLFLDPQIRKKDLWFDLLLEMHLRGFQIPDTDALDSKMRNLKKRYKIIQEQRQTKGPKPIRWKFFDKMYEITSITASDAKSEFELNWTPPIGSKRPVVRTEEYRWEDDAVELLLDAYKRRRELFLNSEIKKRDLWTEILHELRAAGHDVESVHMLDAKMRNMKRTYRRKKQEMLTGDYTEWRYFDQLDEIFSNDNLVNTLFERAEIKTSATTRDPKTPSEDNKWDRKATEFLLDAYQRKLDLFRNSRVSRKELWKNIWLEMRAAGFVYENMAIVDRKLRNMKKTYIRHKGRLEEEGGECNWIYFDKMDELFRDIYLGKFSFRNDEEEMVSCDENTYEYGGLYALVKQEISSPKNENAHSASTKSRTFTKTSRDLDRKPGTSIAFEFITTTSDGFGAATNVKTEPIACDTIDDKSDEYDCGKIRLSQGGKFLFVCGFCDEEHKNMIEFGTHLKKRHGNKLNSTDTREPPDESTNEVEVLSNTPSNELDDQDVTFSLNASEVISKNNANMNTDRMIEPAERQCKYCGEEFATRVLCMEHEITHPVDSAYQCWYCPEKFRDYKRRNAHIRVHTGERPYKCNECLKTFAQKWQQQRHARTHLEKEFKCQKCGKEFFSKIGLHYHQRRNCQHEVKQVKGSVGSYVCEQCGKTFQSRHYLEKHLKRHSGIFDNICQVCGKGFYCKTNLKAHMYIHSGVMPFECEICDRRFPKKSALATHLKLHSEDKSYPCDICGKDVTSTALPSHLRSHRVLLTVAK